MDCYGNPLVVQLVVDKEDYRPKRYIAVVHDA